MAFLVAAGVCVLYTGLAGGLVLAIPDLTHAALLALLFIVCVLPWFFWEREPDLFAPIYFTSIFLTLIYPVRTLMLILFPEYVVSDFPPPYDAGLLTRGLLYIIVGIIIYLFFYYNPPKILITRSAGFSLQPPQKSWPLMILLIYLTGWTVRIYQISTQNYLTFLTGEGYDPRSYTLLSYFAELSVIAYILTWVYWMIQEKHDAKSWFLLLAVVVPEAIYVIAIQGAKTHLVRLILFPMMAYYLVRRKMPAKILVPAVAFVVLFVFPYVQTYRDIYLERFGGNLEIFLQEDLSIASQSLTEMYSRPGYYSAGISNAPYWLISSVVFLNRWAGLDGLMAVLTNVPDRFGFVYGKDLLLIPFALVPRTIWPDKPVSDVQSIFDKEITSSVGSSTSPYPIAEGYFNGGLVGIVLVMFTLAILQKVLYSGFFLPRQDNTLAICVYIWLFIWIIWIDSWVLPMYVSLLQRVAVLSLVVFFMTRFSVNGHGKNLPVG